jgi:hypothetical protein
VGAEVPRLQFLGGQGTGDPTARGTQGPEGEEAAGPADHGPTRERSMRTLCAAQLPRRLEDLLPAGGHAARPPSGRVDPPPTAAGAAQTVETRDDHVPANEAPRSQRGRGPAGAANSRRWGRNSVQLLHTALPPRATTTGWECRDLLRNLTHLNRRRRTVCPVVWQGEQEDEPPAPMPINRHSRLNGL